jgi:hypothetical protein
MTPIRATITAELIEHADGRPIAYIDATGVAIFAYQECDGTYVIEICARDDTALGRLTMLLDGRALLRASAPVGNSQAAVGEASARSK